MFTIMQTVAENNINIKKLIIGLLNECGKRSFIVKE